MNYPGNGLSFNDLKKAELKDQFPDNPLSRKRIPTGVEYASSPGEHKITRRALDSHLEHGSFSILTAHNPGDKELSAGENSTRNQALEQKLKDSGAIYHRLTGKYNRQEESFMVHHTAGVSPEKIEDMAREFGQESLLHSSRGQHKMKYVSGPKAGMHRPGQGWTRDKKADNFYSHPVNRPKEKFSANIDWDTLQKSAIRPLRFIIQTLEGPALFQAS